MIGIILDSGSLRIKGEVSLLRILEISEGDNIKIGSFNVT